MDGNEGLRRKRTDFVASVVGLSSSTLLSRQVLSKDQTCVPAKALEPRHLGRFQTKEAV